LRRLEKRLDNIVYRLGLANTMSFARQLVSHGHILVDKKRVNIPSFSCLPHQTITLRDTSSISKMIKENLKRRTRKLPNYLSLDVEKLTALVNQEIFEIPSSFNELLVIEYYSNRI
jgi:small subunit ribosomal protein S4